MSQTQESLQEIIEKYKKSSIQSEAEVRSKLIVPLLEYLGYPSELRAEEFPVYGFEGGKKLPLKHADFLLFSDREFSLHKRFSQNNQKWVQDHSLLVVEAKKIGEMPQVLGQPQYYTVWTRAVAYLVTDGQRICGYYYNENHSDTCYINCSIADLSCNNLLENFSFEKTQAVKANNGNHYSIDPCVGAKIIQSPDELNLPTSTISYMKNALGKDAAGLDDLKITSRFLNLTDTYLQLDLRYNVPPYMYYIPRRQNKAELYIENSIFPLLKGEVLQFYRNDNDCFSFNFDFLEIVCEYQKNLLRWFELGYHVIYTDVASRMAKFALIKKCISSNDIVMRIDDQESRILRLPMNDKSQPWINKETVIAMTDFYIYNLEQLKTIEDYYAINFILKQPQTKQEQKEMYHAIDVVYKGIVCEKNCYFSLPENFISEETIIKEFEFVTVQDVQIPIQTIQGVDFVPTEIAIMPGRLSPSDNMVFGCCRYSICEKEDKFK